MREPPAEGEVKHVLPLPAYLDGEGKNAKWDVVSALKERDRPLYNRFGNENFLAERKPQELERTDRIVLVSAAIEALCDLGNGPTGGGHARWGALSDRFGVWDEIRGSYSGKEIEEAKSLARDLRKGNEEGRTRSGEELSLAQTAAIYPVIATAVKLAASRVAQQGIESGWDDAVFESNFER